MKRAWWLRGFLAAVLVVVGVVVFAETSPAAAACDPAYGCQPSTPPGGGSPECNLSTMSAAPGDKVTATVRGVAAGSEVSLLFDGSVVDTATASDSGEATIIFTTPAEPEGSTHTVVFSGPGFSCDTTVGSPFAVLGSEVTRRSGSSLAATGARIAVYLAMAAVLIVIGSELVRAARRRQQEVSRQLRREMTRYASRR